MSTSYLPEEPRTLVCEKELDSVPQTVPPPARQARPGRPLISVIVLNYNGANWLDLCLTSLRNQTIFDRIEIIVADNASPDGSTGLAEVITENWPNAQTTKLGGNFGYSEGNNRAARFATGRFLFFSTMIPGWNRTALKSCSRRSNPPGQPSPRRWC